MFAKILNHPRITVRLGVDYFDIRDSIDAAHTVYTGPIDAFFDYCFGPLPYRSIRFEHLHIADMSCYQPVGTINYPNDELYTRVTEFKHITGQVHSGTSIVREYPQDGGDPYYPIPRAENEERFKKYEELTKLNSNVTFVGRLAQYRYYNMDQVVAAALKKAEYITA